MNEAAHQAFGERFAETAYRLLRGAGEAEAARRLPAIREALANAAAALAEIAGEDAERAARAANFGFTVRGAELGYFGSERPRTLAEVARRARVREIEELLNGVTPNQSVRFVEDLGADPETVSRRCGRLWIVPGSHEIMRDTDDRDAIFATAPEERSATYVIVEAMADQGELLLDFVAWNVAEPAEFWMLLNKAAILGEPSGAGDGPLIVHRTPAEWLATNGDGIVVLSDRAGPDLACAPEWIAAEDADHARQLAKLIFPFADPRRIIARAAP